LPGGVRVAAADGQARVLVPHAGSNSWCLNAQDVKTTFVNCLAASIPSREPMVTCEEVFGLNFPPQGDQLDERHRFALRSI
jgi:hypothetical protein